MKKFHSIITLLLLCALTASADDESTDPVLLATYKGEVIQYTDDDGNPDDYYGECMLYGYKDVQVDVYDQYVLVHNWANAKSNPRDLKVYIDNENSKITKLVVVNGSKESTITSAGYVYTGLAAEDDENFIN